MIFDNLHTWRQWQYLPTIHRLMVFDKTGQRVAEWYIENGIFWTLVNTLPPPDKYDFTHYVEVWWEQVLTCWRTRK